MRVEAVGRDEHRRARTGRDRVVHLRRPTRERGGFHAVLANLRPISEAHLLVEVGTEGIEERHRRVLRAVVAQEERDHLFGNVLFLVEEVDRDQTDSSRVDLMLEHIHPEIVKAHTAHHSPVSKEPIEHNCGVFLM